MILAITSLLLTLVVAMADSQSCNRETTFTSFAAEFASGETIDGFCKCLGDYFKVTGKKYDYVVSDVPGPEKWIISTDKANGYGCLANGANIATADNGEICKTIDAAQKQIQSGRRKSTAVKAQRIIVIIVYTPCCITVIIIM